jgi:hypothetical protein
MTFSHVLCNYSERRSVLHLMRCRLGISAVLPRECTDIKITCTFTGRLAQSRQDGNGISDAKNRRGSLEQPHLPTHIQKVKHAKQEKNLGRDSQLISSCTLWEIHSLYIYIYIYIYVTLKFCKILNQKKNTRFPILCSTCSVYNGIHIR